MTVWLLVTAAMVLCALAAAVSVDTAPASTEQWVADRTER